MVLDDEKYMALAIEQATKGEQRSGSVRADNNDTADVRIAKKSLFMICGVDSGSDLNEAEF